MKKIYLILITIFILNSPAEAILDTSKEPPHQCNCENHIHNDIVVKDNSILTIKDCISIGVQNSPIIKEYAHKLEIAKSNVGAAKAVYFPEFSVGVGYKQEFNSNREDYIHNYRELPTVGVALNKMIWDFGRSTANIKMEEFFKIAAEYEFEDSVCSTVFDIKHHYYNLLAKQALLKAAKINLEMQEALINEMKANKKDQADVLNAKIELLSIKMKHLEAENEYKNAKEALNNAIYLENAPNYTIYETQTFQYNPPIETTLKTSKSVKAPVFADETIFQHPNYSYDQAVKKAYQNSPDLKVLISTKNAMEQALIVIKRTYYPELTGGVGYDFINTNLYKNNGFAVAVALNSSLNAMKQKYDVKSAKAQVDLAQTEIETFKKNLYFRVRKALNSVNLTKEKISLAQNQVKVAMQALEITNKNYLANKMNQLEVENARNAYYLSIVDVINTQYDYNIALINLEMSMHEHLIDYHDDAEHAAEFHEGNESDTLGKLINCKKQHKY